jgi:nicotinamide-nucleotide amidase
VTLPNALTGPARTVAEALVEQKGTIAVAESSAGGLISAALLSVPGASAYFLGGTVIYTGAAGRGFLGDVIEIPLGMRGATEQFARYLCEAVRAKLGTTWGVSETGATGPAGNPYGDPAGHAWVGVHGPDGAAAAVNVLTGSADRDDNMFAFAAAALELLAATVTSAR